MLHSLRRLDQRLIGSPGDEIRAFVSTKNEIARLPSMLDYHRKLGVTRFLVVDNDSTDGTVDLLRSQPDVHVFSTTGSYQEARNGIDWIEMLLHIYGQDAWCLILDADELLVYPGCETVGIAWFCVQLEARGLDCLATHFIDCYADGPIARTSVAPGRPPLESAPCFDASGYHYLPSSASRIPRIFGGPRARLFWPEIDLAGHAERMPHFIRRAFDETAYLRHHPDVAQAVGRGTVTSGLHHYCEYGRAEGRATPLRPVPDWPETEYLLFNPDVAESVASGVFHHGLEHYVRFGQFEGRLLWEEGPPCLSQVPLIRWNGSMRLGVGRHGLSGGSWRRNDVVGGVLLHFRLMSDFLLRADANSADAARARDSTWARENRRYGSAVRSAPELSASGPHSLKYRDSGQFVDLGIVTALSEV